MGFRHILFPVDFSPRCYGAVPFVRALAARYKAALTLVHVAPDGGREKPSKNWRPSRRREFPTIPVTRMVEEGDPGACITDLAQLVERRPDHDADAWPWGFTPAIAGFSNRQNAA